MLNAAPLTHPTSLRKPALCRRRSEKKVKDQISHYRTPQGPSRLSYGLSPTSAAGASFGCTRLPPGPHDGGGHWKTMGL
ncbi:hypothetical protein AGIG_G10473 [Arapaima gigas]